MEPRIVEREAFTVVGLLVRSKNENNEIAQAWQAFTPRIPEIKHVVHPQVAYGVCGNMDMDSGEFDYVAGFEVSDAEEIPAGLVSWEVPAARYAVFATTLPTVAETYRYAYETWLPQSGYRLTGGPDFERYGPEFDPQDPDSPFEIYVPIQ